MFWILSKRNFKSDPGEKFGQFALHERISAGGMAEIWLVTNPEGKPFALRRLLPDLVWNLKSRHRFFRGAEIFKRVSGSPYFITYVDHGKIKGWPYILMEYVEASNLKELIARRDPIYLENIAQFLLDAAEALLHMHNRGFMHLDFKPENILVTRNAQLKLIDFDLARPIPDKPTRYRDNPGTPSYMAPEQLMHQPFDQRADIFAYGVFAYEMVTLQKPFPGSTPDEILNRQLNRSGFITPRQHNPDVPPQLERIILKCLETDPNRRYPLTEGLVYDLRNALYVKS